MIANRLKSHAAQSGLRWDEKQSAFVSNAGVALSSLQLKAAINDDVKHVATRIEAFSQRFQDGDISGDVGCSSITRRWRLVARRAARETTNHARTHRAFSICPHAYQRKRNTLSPSSTKARHSIPTTFPMLKKRPA